MKVKGNPKNKSGSRTVSKNAPNRTDGIGSQPSTQQVCPFGHSDAGARGNYRECSDIKTVLVRFR